MKHILFILLTTVSILSCKAQVPLIEKYGNITNGTYYQDTNNDLGKLQGIWQFNNGDEIFKLILEKKNHRLVTSSWRNISYHQDVLYGEYQYVNTNNIQVVNTLNNIFAYTDVSEHLIYGNYIMEATHVPVCSDCLPDERRVEVSIEDPERDYFDYNMIIRHVPEQQFGQAEHIKVFIKMSDMGLYPEGEPTDDRLPLMRELILYKQ
ncbi:DUF6705 family protein [Bizionia myxarmorum]|uniref:DUF6705 domain-containing protein n=1 Tax=Bizionia myxarmorum TaxID=291186 RepID=A0A5D0RCK9_9FLAO|nr:DUF6705 family protein [Bizionia myxarmorum]TYB78448.1 hypothetical protein ES674_01310 [Bizionia myxarmorum]